MAFGNGKAKTTTSLWSGQRYIRNRQPSRGMIKGSSANRQIAQRKQRQAQQKKAARTAVRTSAVRQAYRSNIKRTPAKTSSWSKTRNAFKVK